MLSVVVELLRLEGLAVDGGFTVVVRPLGVSGGRGVVANNGRLAPRKSAGIRARGPWIMMVLRHVMIGVRYRERGRERVANVLARSS
jgi:hypothetical protein